MKPTYVLGIDAAKHKMRVALSNRSEHVLFEKDLSVEATGLRQLLAAIKRQVNAPEQLLVLIEATGLLHLNWSAALTKAGYAVAVINPLIARRLYTLQNSIRDNKSDPIDARGLCTIGLLHGEKLLAHYRFSLRPEQFTLQRAQSVRKALRSAVTNLKKTYQSLMDLSFPELGGLLQLDGVGIRQLLIQAPTPAAIAGKRLSTLEKNWMVRPKAAALKALAADSMADPDLAAASAPALVALLQALLPWKRVCTRSISRSQSSPARQWILKVRRSLKPSPALDQSTPPRLWLGCPSRFCAPEAIAKSPHDSRPLWATTRACAKAANGRATPR